MAGRDDGAARRAARRRIGRGRCDQLRRGRRQPVPLPLRRDDDGLPDADLAEIKAGATAGRWPWRATPAHRWPNGKAQFRRVLRRFVGDPLGRVRRDGRCPRAAHQRLLQPGPCGRRLTPPSGCRTRRCSPPAATRRPPSSCPTSCCCSREQPEILEPLRARAGAAPVGGRGGAALHLAGHRPVPAHHPRRCAAASPSSRTRPRCCSCTAPPTTTSATTSGPTSSSSTATRAASPMPTTSASPPASTSASAPTSPAA